MIQVEMSETEFASKSRELERDLGITLGGNVGTIERNGVTAAYTHHNGLLTIHIVDKPAFVSRAYCERRLEEWLVAESRRDHV